VLDLIRELRDVAAALNAAGVTYALAGGLAVSLYTAPRATQDIDFLLAAADVDRVVVALQPLGFRTAGRPMRVASGRMDIQRLIKIDGADVLPLDLLLPLDHELTGILGERAKIIWQGTTLSIVTLSGLRTLKRLRGSAQDRADLDALGPDSP
jgi:aminoglycoside-2''-adenylyltransferase